MKIIGHTEVDDTPLKEEDHPIKAGIPTETEDLQEEEDHKTMGHLIEMEDHQGALIEEDLQDLEDLLDQ